MQPRVVAEKQLPACLYRHPDAFEIEQGFEPLLERRTLRQPGKVIGGEAALRVHPRGNLFVFAHVCFKPAIGVGDLLAKRRFNHGSAFGGGISHRSISGLRRNGRGDEDRCRSSKD